jgi:hypothetical protein
MLPYVCIDSHLEFPVKMLSQAQHADYAQHLSVCAVSCTVTIQKENWLE